MILRRVALAAALLAVSAAVCKADTVGPLTFGSGFPFGADGPSLFDVGGGTFVVPLLGSGLYVNSLNGETAYDYTYTFSFDMAPGWEISGMQLSNNVDYGGPEIQNADFTDWGFSFAEKVMLCPTGGSCASATTGRSVHAAGLAPLSLGSAAGPGTGIFEVAVDVRNQEIQTIGGLRSLNIFVNPSPVPEPGSVWLLASGIAGLPIAGLWRRRARRRFGLNKDVD